MYQGATLLSLVLTITIAGVTPRPCPALKFPVPDGAVNPTILNPAVVFTDTVEFTDPAVFVEVLLPASQLQPT